MATRKAKDPLLVKDLGKLEKPVVKAHLSYLVKVLTQSAIYEMGKTNPGPPERIAIMMVQAVINDFTVNIEARKDKAQIKAEFEKIILPYMDSLMKQGGGGGGDDQEQEILEGP